MDLEAISHLARKLFEADWTVQEGGGRSLIKRI
jgi:hypothetical protein